jgi:hypothetical protein
MALYSLSVFLGHFARRGGFAGANCLIFFLWNLKLEMQPLLKLLICWFSLHPCLKCLLGYHRLGIAFSRDSFGSGCCSVNVRPYRYPPATKDEIEHQVREMLSTRAIRPSSSPFSSSVLLVKKKNATFHFCVDLRHLNTIIVKNHYPAPIVEGLLDELSGASWFFMSGFDCSYH